MFLLLQDSYLLIFPGDNVNDFVASPLIRYCSFSSLNLSLTARISFYLLSKRFFLKRKGLSDAKVVTITKKEYGFAVHFFAEIVETQYLMND